LMTVSSRRTFLLAGGTSVAAVGLLSMLPETEAVGDASRPADAEPLVVHVPDPRGSEVRIHAGDRTTVLHDRALVTRLLSAASIKG
jgi:hypothetical protein